LRVVANGRGRVGEADKPGCSGFLSPARSLELRARNGSSKGLSSSALETIKAAGMLSKNFLSVSKRASDSNLTPRHGSRGTTSAPEPASCETQVNVGLVEEPFLLGELAHIELLECGGRDGLVHANLPEDRVCARLIEEVDRVDAHLRRVRIRDRPLEGLAGALLDELALNGLLEKLVRAGLLEELVRAPLLEERGQRLVEIASMKLVSLISR
jgi:hypothetical protein